MSDTLQNLREDYKELFWKNAYHWWDENKLFTKIEEKEAELEKNKTDEVLDTPETKEKEAIEKTPEIETIEDKKEETSEKISDEEKKEEMRRMEEARKINNQFIQTIPENLVPVYKDWQPYVILDNQYIPYHKAEIELQERRVKQETAKLEHLKQENK